MRGTRIFWFGHAGKRKLNESDEKIRDKHVYSRAPSLFVLWKGASLLAFSGLGCLSVRMRVYSWACPHACVSAYACVRMRAFERACVCVRMRARVRARVHVCEYIRVLERACVRPFLRMRA